MVRLVTLALLSAMMLGCSDSPFTPTPAAATAYKYFFVNSNTSFCTYAVEINGKQYDTETTFEEFKASGIKWIAAPFIDGANKIRITVTPKKPSTFPSSPSGSADITLCLSPTAMRDYSKTVELLNVRASRCYYEAEFSIEFAGGRPGSIDFIDREWLDQEHAKLRSTCAGHRDSPNTEWKRFTQKTMTSDGKTLSETLSENGRLVTGKFFKPDGSPASEVKDGNGMRMSFYTDGAIYSETPYKDGFIDGEEKTYFGPGKIESITSYAKGKAHGPFREFHENGTLAIQGQNAEEMVDGLWISFDKDGKENQRAEYKAGKLISGKDIRRPR